MKVDWHCPECEYLHLKDNGIANGLAYVSVKCIMCKREERLSPDDVNTKWRINRE